MSSDRKPIDPTARSQWPTLDQSARSRRGLGQSTIFSMVRHAPVGPFSPLIAALVVLMLVGVTLYVGWKVRQSIRDGIRNSLQTVLAANVTALDLWLSEQRVAAQRIVSDPKIRSALLEILEQASETPGLPDSIAPNDAHPAGEILAAETQRLQSAGYLGWTLITSLGQIVDSSDNRFDGQQLPLTKSMFARLAAGHPIVTRPLAIKTSPGEPMTAVMCSIVPLQHDVRTIGAIALMIDPAKQFTDILTVARIGNSGETYAFDDTALLISRSRFEAQLRNVGLLKPDQSSPLVINVRDPGEDLRDLDRVPGNPEDWPMTTMADSATRGGDGVDVVGYRNYRGVPVVGAWRWLSEYGFGLATEQEVDEAFVPLQILRNSFIALLASVVIAGASLFALAWITHPRDPPQHRVEALNRRLGQYDLQQRIGRGGMGTVYLGAHGLLDRKVAIKVLENTQASERSLARFQREVQLTASLKHPNTIEIYDFGRTDDGTFFYVMEFVDGISLEQLVDYYGRQPAERVIYLLLQICGSIAEAHQSGMVHRDIKPANVLLTSRSGIHDLIKVLDFGLAKQTDHDSLQLTRSDSLTGTPLFMSPESIRDASAADTLSDIYSIGAVGYTLLTGKPPFDGDTPADVCAQKLHGEPQRPENKIQVPLAGDLQDVLMRCLRLDPEMRPQSVGELAALLSTCSDCPYWTQQDAALWWQEVFDGPYLDDFEFDPATPPPGGTRGDTAVNDKRQVVSPSAQSTAN
ncbi:serine/threonine protein kinase [Stieleria sp. TO1_6]|nr:serine/threonine protein kinase [Stieleria tagensis]